MSKTAVVYIHGYGSAGSSDTAKLLAAALGDSYHVISPNRDETDPFTTMCRLRDLCKSLVPLYDDVILAGTSLGGFYANYLSLDLDMKALLVNPALKPSNSLATRSEVRGVVLAEYTNIEAGAAVLSTRRPPRIVVVGTDDDVIDPVSNGMTLSDVADVRRIKMGHRLTEHAYAADLIKFLANNNVAPGSGD